MADSPEIRRLAREAKEALEAHNADVAIDRLAALEAADPTNPLWPRRLADLYRLLGRTQHAIEALSRSAGLYTHAGDLVKAIAISKEILALDPASAARPQDRIAQAIPIVQGAKIPEPPGVRLIELEEDEPLEAVQLSRVVPGSKEVEHDPDQQQQIYEIPLEVEIDLEEEPSADLPPVPSARDTLPKTPLFSALSAQSFLKLAAGARMLRLKPGEVVFKQGDPGDALYVVADGWVRVVAEGPPRTELGRLDDGEFFGEIALVTDEPRSATVEAATDAWVLALDRALVHQVMEEDGWVITVMLKFLRDRFVDRLMRTHPLFKALPPEDRVKIAEKARFVEIEAGRALIRQGDLPKGLFIMVAGKVDITREQDGVIHKLAVLKPGDLCGEMSLLSRKPAVATARAGTKCFAIELPAGAFYQLVTLNFEALDYVKNLAEARKKAVGELHAEGRIAVI